jgi:hypothetical protein
MSTVKCSHSIFQISLKNITVRPGDVIDRIQYYPKAASVRILIESSRNKSDLVHPGRNESKQLRCCKEICTDPCPCKSLNYATYALS